MLWRQRLFCDADRVSDKLAGVWTRRVPLQRLPKTGDAVKFAGPDNGLAVYSTNMAIIIPESCPALLDDASDFLIFKVRLLADETLRLVQNPGENRLAFGSRIEYCISIQLAWLQ